VNEKVTPPPVCAQCGSSIPPRALACPECGADERTGWRESSVYDGLDLPDSAWSDDTASEDKRSQTNRVNGIAWYWWCIAVAVLLFLGLSTLALL
jgi:hypothetical protein